MGGEADLALLGEANAEPEGGVWAAGGLGWDHGDSARLGRRHPHQADRDATAGGEVLPRPLAPAGRRGGRGHDVLEAVSGARTAVVARGPAAVLDGGLGQRVLPVGPEEVTVQAGRDVVPGQRLVLLAVAVGHLVEAETLSSQRLLPQREVEALRPLLEGATGPPDPLDDPAHTAVAPAGQSLGGRGGRIVPADGEALGRAGGFAQEDHLALELGHAVLAVPLEGCVWLGHE